MRTREELMSEIETINKRIERLECRKGKILQNITKIDDTEKRDALLECEIRRLIARGLDKKEVAKKLGIGVQSHHMYCFRRLKKYIECGP